MAGGGEAPVGRSRQQAGIRHASVKKQPEYAKTPPVSWHVHSNESKVCPQQVSVPLVHLEPNSKHVNPAIHDGKETTVTNPLLATDGSVAAVVVVVVLGHRPMPETLTPCVCALHALE
jgi:hypothetical protein